MHVNGLIFSVFCVQADFRDYPPLLRQAVSIARKIQDPLMEYAQVCSTDEDILCLKLHPLQVRSKMAFNKKVRPCSINCIVWDVWDLSRDLFF